MRGESASGHGAMRQWPPPFASSKRIVGHSSTTFLADRGCSRSGTSFNWFRTLRTQVCSRRDCSPIPHFCIRKLTYALRVRIAPTAMTSSFATLSHQATDSVSLAPELGRRAYRLREAPAVYLGCGLRRSEGGARDGRRLGAGCRRGDVKGPGAVPGGVSGAAYTSHTSR